MNDIKTLKLAVFEAASNNLIDKDLSEEMISFCERANMNNKDDVETLAQIADTLITVSESAENNESSIEGETCTYESVRLEIFESARNGEITDEEMNTLLNMMDKTE